MGCTSVQVCDVQTTGHSQASTLPAEYLSRSGLAPHKGPDMREDEGSQAVSVFGAFISVQEGQMTGQGDLSNVTTPCTPFLSSLDKP